MNRVKLLIFLLGGIVFFGCALPDQLRLTRYRESKTLMGTVVHIDVCLSGQKDSVIVEAYQKIWNRLGDIHWRMSIYNDASDVIKINRSFQSPVEVGEDTYYVVEQAVKYSQLTSGAFDVTVFPLILLWRGAVATDAVPARDAILSVKESMGADMIKLHSGSEVELLHARTQIDLGGIAKGYAIDEAARIFREAGVLQFYIDAGGDIYVEGENCENQPWHIAIRNPRDKSKAITIVELMNQAVTTSGDYERFYDVQGQRWSHIMNPRTGYPQKGVVSASVIAPTALEADALSTALTILTPEEGVALIDSLGPDYQSMVIFPQGRSGFLQYKSAEWMY